MESASAASIEAMGCLILLSLVLSLSLSLWRALSLSLSLSLFLFLFFALSFFLSPSRFDNFGGVVLIQQQVPCGLSRRPSTSGWEGGGVPE